MNIGQAVARRVRDLLIARDMTQYRLAKEMMVSHNTITSIVTAKNKTANLNTLFLMCRVFNMTIDEFFNDSLFKGDLDIE